VSRATKDLPTEIRYRWRPLGAQFGDALRSKPVDCLYIPDEYEFMQPALVTFLEAAVTPHLAVA